MYAIIIMGALSQQQIIRTVRPIKITNNKIRMVRLTSTQMQVTTMGQLPQQLV
jgi:hypothetical protein